MVQAMSKTQFFTALFIIFIQFSCSNHRTIKNVKDGSFIVKANYMDSLRDGPAMVYNDSNELLSITNYKNGSREGISKHFFHNGLVADSVQYKGDREYGFFTHFNQDGTIRHTNYRYFGLDYGPDLWYDNSVLKTFSFIDFGKEVIAKAIYRDNGELDSIIMFNPSVSMQSVERNGKPMLRLFALLPQIPKANQLYSIGLEASSNSVTKLADVQGKDFFIDTIMTAPPAGFHYYLGCNFRAKHDSINKFYMVP
jgi:antitoxin component YwqK of YwqJK toxin-antitoxin module